MSKLSEAVICFGVDIIPWVDKKTGEARLMCRANTLSDSDSNDRSTGRSFIAEELPEDNNGELAKRLMSELKQAVSKGYDYLLIIPHYKRLARGRGDAKSVIGDYELVGFGNLNYTPIDIKQPVTDVKQPVKS